MKKIIMSLLILFFISNIFSNENEKKTENPYKKLVVAAWKLSSRVSPNPIKLNYVFDKSFFKHISKEKTVEILKKLYEENGNVVNVTSVTYHNDKNGDFFFHTDKNKVIPVTLTVNDNGKIIGLFFRPSFEKVENPENIFKKFENLNYEKKSILIKKLSKNEDIIYAFNENLNYEKKSILIKKLSKNEDIIYAFNENLPLAIGSAFKLYILAYIIEKDIKWDKVLKLTDKNRSLPSGIMHLFPENSPLTVFSAAQAMISNSDNTATDILIDLLGRENIEKYLSTFYHSRPELNIPFLKTKEFFILKSSKELAEEYINSDSKNRRKILKRIETQKPDINKLDLTKPLFINSIEWFASPSDICKLFEYFIEKNNEYANTILSINPGLDTKSAGFVWSGFKGGSETGVISTNWLLKTKEGNYYCLSATVNDSKNIIDEKEYFKIIQEIINNIK